MSKKIIFVVLVLVFSVFLSACSIDKLGHWLGSQTEDGSQASSTRRPKKEESEESAESTTSQEETTTRETNQEPAQKAIDAMLLEPDQDYYFDLDGDGQAEKIRYSHGDDWDTDVVLMVNDEEIYRRQMSGFGALYTIADLDAGEKGLNLLLGEHIENYVITYTEFQTYADGQLTVVATSDNNQALACFGTVEITGETGDGTFFMLSNQHNEFIGSFYIEIPYMYNQGQVAAIPTDTFSLAIYSLEYSYELTARIPLYEDSFSGSPIIRTLETGDTINILQIIPLNHGYCQEGPREDDNGDASDSRAVYLYVADNQGNEGWLFLDKSYSYYEDRSLFREIPAWG